MGGDMDQSQKDAKRIQDLAQQLAAQFSAMRPTPTNPVASSSAATHASAAASDADITQLAAQLSQLLGQVASTEKELQQQQELLNPTTDPFASVPDPSIYEKEFTDVYLNVNASVLRFEDRELLDLASEEMPIDKFFDEAESMAKDYPNDSIDDIVVRRLLHWFKNDYFTWVNQPPCARCQAKTTATGAVAPSAQERQDGAGLVETYKCTQDGCLEITRFPRYGGASKILFRTRRGRCGEWANIFTVCCRALGYKARYIHDTTDHVWTEVWSDHKKRWIHCDSCEAAYDQPLLYTTGWSKAISYCVAFSAEEVVDVTRRYTVDYDAAVLKRRRSVREPVLAKYLHSLSESNLARLSLDPSEVQEVRQRQRLEKDDLSATHADVRTVETQDRVSGTFASLLI
ncbi:unnamed protein product [Mortierella alpina]